VPRRAGRRRIKPDETGVVGDANPENRCKAAIPKVGSNGPHGVRVPPLARLADLVRRESEFLLYAAPDGAVKVSVLFRDETAWLTQRALAELFGVKVPAITKHLRNIFESGGLAEASVASILETTVADGKTYKTRFYNLDAIIAVGYRVNSYQATQFRIWATQTLREFLIKGFVLDDERLKQGKTVFGNDYFDDLLERIREIRASERRFYQKVTDIYALAVDYDAHASLTHDFFRDRAEQAALGHHRPDLRRAHLCLSRCHQALHGPHNLEACAE